MAEEEVLVIWRSHGGRAKQSRVDRIRELATRTCARLLVALRAPSRREDAARQSWRSQEAPTRSLARSLQTYRALSRGDARGAQSSTQRGAQSRDCLGMPRPGLLQ